MPDHNARSAPAPFEELEQRYRCIVADPPWRFGSFTKADPAKQYSTMTIEDICALPVEALAEDDCHLWLWAVNGLLHDAHHVVDAWGFKPVTVVTWCKRTPGVGHYLRNNTEHLLLASRGKPMVPAAKPLSTWYVWQRGAHSAKPEAALDLVEQVSPGPYLELFCRRQRFGWDTWGRGFETEVGASA